MDNSSLLAYYHLHYKWSSFYIFVQLTVQIVYASRVPNILFFGVIISRNILLAAFQMPLFFLLSGYGLTLAYGMFIRYNWTYPFISITPSKPLMSSGSWLTLHNCDFFYLLAVNYDPTTTDLIYIRVREGGLTAGFLTRSFYQGHYLHCGLTPQY
jgi:hypothetical protein